jgi:hypothetical protein
VSKSLAMIAFAFGLLAIATGSAQAGVECDGYSNGAQSASLETQTASTGPSLPQTPKPETKIN